MSSSLGPSPLEEMKANRRGIMVVLSSPSGAGKTTLTRKLLKENPDMAMSVSATTRQPRPGEKDGEDYYFISKLGDGRDVVFDIDWQGAQQLTQAAADDLVKIFILPPNMVELEKRLRTRAQDSDEVIAKRMSKSENEISHWPEYDYVIVNEDVDMAMNELRTIVASERMRRRRQPWLGGFVKSLTTGG